MSRKKLEPSAEMILKVEKMVDRISSDLEFFDGPCVLLKSAKNKVVILPSDSYKLIYKIQDDKKVILNDYGK